MPKGELAVDLDQSKIKDKSRAEGLEKSLKRGERSIESIKRKKAIALEDLPTIKEDTAPTILETKKDEPEEAVGDEDMEEVDEQGAPKVEAPSLDEFYQGLGGEEKFDQQIKKIEGELDREALAKVQKLSEQEKDQYVDSGLEAEFDDAWKKLEGDVDQATKGVLGEEEMQDVDGDADNLVATTEREQTIKIGIKPETKLWDVEQGRQRIESLGRVAKKGLSKAGGALKNLFSGKIGNGLSSFGRTMRDLGYGTVSAGENLPKAAFKKMSEGTRSVAREAVFAYKEIATNLPSDYKKAEKEMKMWQERRLEVKEKKEYERLKALFDRYQELRKKFEVLE